MTHASSILTQSFWDVRDLYKLKDISALWEEYKLFLLFKCYQENQYFILENIIEDVDCCKPQEHYNSFEDIILQYNIFWR